MPAKSCPEHIKGGEIDKERYRRLKELFGEDVNTLGKEIEFEELPKVVEYEKLIPLITDPMFTSDVAEQKIGNIIYLFPVETNPFDEPTSVHHSIAN
ncbi:Hypothetical predicted protein [Octopus vulgaris]|uniref:Uncharacterized protein n=1 Tax=Octopus vulgaris TaxID=6645 RepID=A0AA36BJ83_OCTVU|nr:Hypothetical predicted protein [Octopus vulgaris]